jgi:hypothetical protein
LKKRIEYIGSLIEGWCKKKIVFARSLLPCGTVWEANPQTTHLATPSHKLTLQLPKELFFLLTLAANEGVFRIFSVLNIAFCKIE